MFDDFYKLLEMFEKSMIENPLNETLKVFNLLSNNSLSKIDLSVLENNEQSIQNVIEKRKNGLPLEYILGIGNFFGNTFCCEPGALIPREETELLVNTVLNRIMNIQQANLQTLNIVDMGTGCGSIAVSIALNSIKTNLFASDLKPETVAVAKKNITKFHLDERVALFQGDLFAPFEGKGLENNIDIVVCNPPYIPSTSLKNMASEIINYEPEEAFNGGAFGIEFYRRLIKDSLIFLKPNGLLLFEIGEGQEKIVSRLFTKIDGYENIEYVDDGKNVRVICVRKKDNN